jgi:DNA-binding beta-propeller fold protein YncE
LCTPYGLAFGPNQQLLVGCGKEKDARSIILDTKTGQVIATLTQVGGSDQVWFNSGDNRYYLAARYNPGGAVLGIIDARSNTWVENVPSVKGAKSLAVDPMTNRVFMPLPQKGVGVFGQE